MNDFSRSMAPLEIDLLRSIFKIANTGFLFTLLALSALLLFSIIFVLVKCPIRKSGFDRSRPRARIVQRIKQFLDTYFRFYRHLLTTCPAPRRTFPIYPFIVMIPLNLLLLFLVPFNATFQGIHGQFDILIFSAILFLNLLIFLLLTTNNDNDTSGNFSIFIHSRLQLNIYFILAVTLLMTVGISGNFDFDSIIRQQSSSYWYTIPKWTIIATPGGFINALIFYIFFLILLQLFQQNDRPIPFNYSKVWESMPNNFASVIIEFWKYSLLTLISLIYITVFLGGYLSPFYQSGVDAASTYGFLWLILKLAVFWSVTNFIYRSIPHLVEEQILTLIYKIVIPVLLISFGLTQLYEYIF